MDALTLAQHIVKTIRESGFGVEEYSRAHLALKIARHMLTDEEYADNIDVPALGGDKLIARAAITPAR